MSETSKISTQRASAIARKWGKSVKGLENGSELVLEEGTLLKEAGDWYYTTKTFVMETGTPVESAPIVSQAVQKPRVSKLTVAFKGGNPRRHTRTLKRARIKARAGRLDLTTAERNALAQYQQHVAARVL